MNCLGVTLVIFFLFADPAMASPEFFFFFHKVEDVVHQHVEQIFQSGGKPQQIAASELLYRVQHPDWYISRLQTI